MEESKGVSTSYMFHFALYNDKRLMHLENAEKRKVISLAIKLYRKEHPLNWHRRLSLLVFCVFLPALLIYIFHGTSFIVSWICISSMFIGYQLESKETPEIIPYLDKVIQ